MTTSNAQHLPLATDEEEANDHVELGTIPSSPIGNQEESRINAPESNEDEDDADEEVYIRI